MGQLPSGTVAFLFTDIESSTKLSQTCAEEMPSLLARHNSLLDAAIRCHGGFVFNIVGDAFCVAFSTVREALLAAVEAQRALRSEAWGPVPVKVRMGLHVGAAELVESDGRTDYKGYAALAFVSRLMSVGYGGQVLVSSAAQALLRDRAAEGVELADLGKRWLKDIPQAERIYQAVAQGLERDFPPLRAQASILNNLPAQLTSFIGRERESLEIEQALGRGRLITLVGPGGTGKTRLSLQTAAAALDSFPDGVWFVELGPLSDPDLVPARVLGAMGVGEAGKGLSADRLAAYLADKTALLVLDNCEHLIDACARLAANLLSASPSLKILASSREALGVPGELAYAVPTLTQPDPKRMPSLEQLSQYEAVRLFIERARLVLPAFAVDEANAPHIAQICYRLDGIPLAIELAAVRIKLLSPEGISARLDDRFKLLASGSRTALPRQQTLRALIDWSYDTLPDPERTLFLSLSVFADSWTLDAAEAVCASSSEASDVFENLAALVGKSLVCVLEPEASGARRYRMLESIRSYAREKRTERGDGSGLRDRHLAYFSAMTALAEPGLRGTDEAAWMARLEADLHNLRAAVEHSLESDPESGLRLVVGAKDFWLRCIDPMELVPMLERLIGAYRKPDALTALALGLCAEASNNQGDAAGALRFSEECLAISETSGDQQARAYGYHCRGLALLSHGEYAEGLADFERSRISFAQTGDAHGQATALYWLSRDHSDLDRSVRRLEEALAMFSSLGNKSAAALCQRELAHHAIQEGRWDSVGERLDQARSIFAELKLELQDSLALGSLGKLAFWQGDYATAIDRYREAAAGHRHCGARLYETWALAELGHALARSGNVPEAENVLAEALRRFGETGGSTGMAFVWEGIAALRLSQGRPFEAATLIASATQARSRGKAERPPLEEGAVRKDLERCRTLLGEEEFQRAVQDGTELSKRDVLRLA